MARTVKEISYYVIVLYIEEPGRELMKCSLVLVFSSLSLMSEALQLKRTQD